MAEMSPDSADKLDQPKASMLDTDLDESSGSDISMSDATEDEEDDAPPIISTGESKKRKHTTEGESNGYNGEITTVKRLKVDQLLAATARTSSGHLHQDKSLLPAEIWHNIFVFTPPRSLGSLLQVNKLFNSYLDPSSTFNKPAAVPLSTSVAKFLDPDSIWQASRVLFRPGMPTPLAGFSELEMWKLACQKSCQFCLTKATQDNGLIDQWHAGPGLKGVRTVWSFAIRSCGSCLIQKSAKEIDLLLSSSDPSLLIPALPFVFLTNENNIVSHASLQSGLPPNIQIAKYFFKPHIEDMKAEFFKAKEMGTAAAEEWIKGLDDLGKDRRNDAVRWERWETLGGVQRMHATESTEKAPVRLPTIVQTPNVASPAAMNPAITVVNFGQQGGSRPSSAGQLVPQAIQVPHHIMPPFSASNPPSFSLPTPNGFSYPPRTAPHQRTKEEAAEMKAARKAEIERRAGLLDPPLSAAVLAHMSSFQAALQIIKPVDDHTWELLKPRLLSQRAEAEQREKDRLLQTRILQEVVDERRHLPHEQQTKESEKEWDDVQAPLRARIAGFADEIIRDGWANGAKVTNENCPQFAAEVLIYVRKRFYAEIAKDDAAVRAAGQEPKADPPNGPYTQKLILENMKWLFDSKIKPHTEQYRKELFLCNGCENNSKFYGFEGVIQHYAAKHTNSLSVGSIVVHWKAEWPEFPPFHTDPTQAKAVPYTLPTSTPYASLGLPAHAGYGWGGYSTTSVSMPNQPANSHTYHPNPPYGQQNGFQNRNPGPQGSQYPGNGQAYQPLAQKEYVPPGFGAQYQGNSQHTYDAPYPGQTYPLPLDHMGSKNGYPPPGSNFAPSQAPADPRVPLYQGANTLPHNLPNPGTQQDPGYRTQLEFVARTAREIWNSTTGIKEMPGSVRVYVIIHHVINRSKSQFPNEPPLAMFIDGLSNKKEMRPVRNINELSCNTCNSDPSRAIPSERKSFSLPQLFNHFQTHHIANQPQGLIPEPYWVTDMVQLPDMAKISALLYTPGMDDYKLKLVADIFPLAFPSPLPRVEAARAAVAQSESFHRNNKFGGRAKNGKENRHGSYASSNNNAFETAPALGSMPPENTVKYDTLTRPPSNDRNRVLSNIRIKKEDEYTETASTYRQADELNNQGRTITNAYPVDYYAHDQRVNDALHQQPALAPVLSNKQPLRAHVAAMGPEDGASHGQSKSSRNRQPSLVTTSMVERITHDIPQGENPDKLAREAEEQERRQEEALRASWKAERIDSMRRMYQPTTENLRGGSYNDEENVSLGGKSSGVMRPLSSEPLLNTRTPQPVQDRHLSQPRQELAYDYDKRPNFAAQGSQYVRERSPELVDHRYKLNNVVYRDERQPSHSSSRGIVSNRYSRYESVRLENDRARSRSPVYVKVGSQPGQYRERSPTIHAPQSEPNHHRPSPLGNMQEIAYDRAPRPEYYYADEPPRVRQPPPQYAEPYEFIRVADPAGDYMIRRPLPIRREQVYAQYDEDPYLRQPAYAAREPIYEAREPVYEAREPVYETRAPVSRSDPAYYEEYDPRNPAPPPPPTLRQVRHQ